MDRRARIPSGHEVELPAHLPDAVSWIGKCIAMVDLVYDELFLHHGEAWHPENRGRLECIVSQLRASGCWATLKRLQHGPATPEEAAWVHDPYYVETLQELSQSGGGEFGRETHATAETYDAAMLAAGGCIAAARVAVAETQGDDGEGARSICLVRPPGHHATADRAMGFCFLNNVALAAEAALRSGLQRVAIVDFDVHHGNGTQDTFYHRRDVLFISLHESPLYPGTGSLDEVGVEDGAGFTVNVPLPAYACDEHYARAFDELVIPLLAQYRPQFVFASAGYDAHHSDPLARTNLSIGAFHRMTAALAAASDEHAGGRLQMVLEGGYDPQWLALCVENTLRALERQAPLQVKDEPAEVHAMQVDRIDAALEHIIATHRSRLGLGG